MTRYEKRFLKNKLSRELTYKTVVGVLGVLQRFSDSTGITNVTDLVDYITSLSVDEFCDYRFNNESISDNPDNNLLPAPEDPFS